MQTCYSKWMRELPNAWDLPWYLEQINPAVRGRRFREQKTERCASRPGGIYQTNTSLSTRHLFHSRAFKLEPQIITLAPAVQFNLDERTENFPCAARHSTEPKNYLSLFGVFPWMVFSHCVYLMWLDSNWRIHRYVFYWSVRSVNLYLTLPDRKKERLSVLVSIKKVTYEQSIFLGSVCASRLSLDKKILNFS